VATLPTIDLAVARQLVDTQFPEFSDLPLRGVEPGGWDNRTFRLGDELVVRIPSRAEYAAQPLKEHRWLPALAKRLPLPIPIPLVAGSPSETCPWHWTISRWLPGETATNLDRRALGALAQDLALFLRSFQAIDASNGPAAGAHSFFRGDHVSVYEDEARRAIAALSDRIDAKRALHVWEAGARTAWQKTPVWVHGDIAPGNLLVQNGRLCAVIDFGCLAVGDPSCDLAIAWTSFDQESRNIFRRELDPDDATWKRGRAWALWKASIIAAGMVDAQAIEGRRAWDTLRAINADETV